jgi:hypothetical protein
MGEVAAARLARRDVLMGSLAAAVAAIAPRGSAAAATEVRAQGAASAFPFKEAKAGVDERHHVAQGHDADVLIRWGDPVFSDAPAFDPTRQTREAQEKQFGYDNDFVGFIPLEGSPDRGLLVVNHRDTREHLMFPGIVQVVEGRSRKDPEELAAELEVVAADKTRVGVEMAAHGGTVIEIIRENGKWRAVPDSRYNRRITATTPVRIAGPAAGRKRMRTSANRTGRRVRGVLNAAGGGITPWHTWLIAEGRFSLYFDGVLAEGYLEGMSHDRYGVPEGAYAWSRFDRRFDVREEPNEPNRFGWVVEVDPLDPGSYPKKRTALGRMRHAGAAMVVNRDGRVVVYMGDAERYDYAYKFVTRGRFNPKSRAANRNLLDKGTLYVARFEEDGTLRWLPLVHGRGPLTKANGWDSQADILISARIAGDVLGATRMDRPCGFQPDARGGRVHLMLNNNVQRKEEEVDPANPRAENAFGHIIEIREDDGDFASRTARWAVMVRCGDPSDAEVGASFAPATTENGWFGMPDACAVDADGRLWVATAGQGPETTGRADGFYAFDRQGAARGVSKLFFRAPVGAAAAGPFFTPDGETLFLAVRHPADGGEDWPGFGRPSYYEDPSTRWPDFDARLPPRPAVLAVTRRGGGKIGG